MRFVLYYIFYKSFISPTTILVENSDSDSTLDARNTELVLAGYNQDQSHNNSTEMSQNHNPNTSSVAVPSLIDSMVINNIEEEDDENLDQDSDKDMAKQIEYHPEVVVHPPREMNKTLSQNSNIGNNKIQLKCRVQYFERVLLLNLRF